MLTKNLLIIMELAHLLLLLKITHVMSQAPHIIH
jgi:hypothetical protein